MMILLNKYAKKYRNKQREFYFMTGFFPRYIRFIFWGKKQPMGVINLHSEIQLNRYGSWREGVKNIHSHTQQRIGFIKCHDQLEDTICVIFPGGVRWGRSSNRHPGHGGTGGLRRHPGQLLSLRGGVPLRLLHHGAGELRRHAGVQVSRSNRIPSGISAAGDRQLEILYT